MSQRRLLVTGGSGFIGTNFILEASRRNGSEILNLDIAPPKSGLPGKTGGYRSCDLLDKRCCPLLRRVSAHPRSSSGWADGQLWIQGLRLCCQPCRNPACASAIKCTPTVRMLFSRRASLLSVPVRSPNTTRTFVRILSTDKARSSRRKPFERRNWIAHGRSSARRTSGDGGILATRVNSGGF